MTTNQWHFLTSTIPSGNLGAVTEDTYSSSKSQKNRNGMKYHVYGSEYHLQADCYQSSDGGGSTIIDTNKNSSPNWKSITPADENTIVTIDVLKYIFYEH